MFKLFRRKLNKKGFTLAELLVVVAIIAILVAIAVPIFANSLENAQIGVNQANARSVKGAAVMEILNDWAVLGEGATTGSGADIKGGWLAAGKVKANGDVEEIHVYIADKTNQTVISDSFVVQDSAAKADTNPLSKFVKADDGSKLHLDGAITSADDIKTKNNDLTIEPVNKSGKVKPAYWVVVYISDVNKIASGESST